VKVVLFGDQRPPSPVCSDFIDRAHLPFQLRGFVGVKGLRDNPSQTFQPVTTRPLPSTLGIPTPRVTALTGCLPWRREAEVSLLACPLSMLPYRAHPLPPFLNYLRAWCLFRPSHSIRLLNARREGLKPPPPPEASSPRHVVLFLHLTQPRLRHAITFSFAMLKHF